MLSEERPEARQDWGDKVFAGLPTGPDEPALVTRFLAGNDFSPHTRRAFSADLRAFACWFTGANREPFTIGRVTTRDVADFRDHLRRERGRAVATVNRALVTVRRFFAWLVATDFVITNPAKGVKELRRQPLAPKGLQKDEIRRLITVAVTQREAEKVRYAEKAGDLSIGLLNDASKVKRDDGVTDNNLFK